MAIYFTSPTNISCWTVWASNATTMATNCVTQSWFTTSTSTNVGLGQYIAQGQAIPQPPPTPEEIAERVRLDAEYRERAKVQEAAREAAKARAEELLLEYLKPEQATCYRKHRYFDVRGRSGKRYRIHGDKGLAGNVHVMDGDKVQHRLCAHDRNVGVPMGDQLLMQKLMLESEEPEFLRVANVH